MCFIKFVNFLTEKDYAEELLTFVRNENYRSGVMTTAGIEPFSRKCAINNGCFNGK